MNLSPPRLSNHLRKRFHRFTFYGNCRRPGQLVKRLSYASEDTPVTRELHLAKARETLIDPRLTAAEEVL